MSFLQQTRGQGSVLASLGCDLSTPRAVCSSKQHRSQQFKPCARPQSRCLRLAASASLETELDAKARRRAAKAAGRQTYKPESFRELVGDAAEALDAGLEDGLKRLEVDFPSLSGDGYKLASDEYIDANLKLAISAAVQLIDRKGLKVHILVPDAGEYRRSMKMFKTMFEQTEGLSMGNLREGRKGLLDSFMQNLAGGSNGAQLSPEEAAKQADLFIAVNASTVELVDLEKYIEETVKEKPLVIWNMELDTLRADLGLLGFPSKDLQYRFLSQFKPVFYIRQRDYAKTVPQPPYNLEYSGCLFREYPGPWQVMFRQSTGVYACVAERAERYALGEVKEELMAAVGLNTEIEGSALQFLRRGYKRSTWWEDDVDLEKSHNWRS